jgi:hypothetical protein
MLSRRRARTVTSPDAIMCSAPAVTDSAAFLWWLRHPRTVPRPPRPASVLLTAVAILRHAPSVQAEVSHRPSGQRINAFLRERRLGIRRRFLCRSVLVIPDQTQPLFAGRSNQAARTNMSRARAEGWSCTEVDGDARPGERVFHLLNPQGNKAGRLHVTVDRHWALIHVLESDAPVGFYLIHGYAVAELRACSVRYALIDSGMAVVLKPGYLYMQGRLGYQVMNVRPVSQPPAAPAVRE